MKQFYCGLFLLLLSFSTGLLAQPHYIVTIHPLGEILRQVAGERAEVEVLLPPGASPHTYELKPSQLREVQHAAALFYGAENLDSWSGKFDNIERISFMELLPDSLRLPIMAQFGSRAGTRLGSDPHFWMDPMATAALLPNLVKTLTRLDPEGEQAYRGNARLFLLNLVQLNRRIEEMLEPVRRRKVLLSHPFFQYFLKRYRIDSIGIIEPAPGAEPTAKELAVIIARCREEKVVAVLTHAQHSDRPPQLIAESTGATLVKLDPLGARGETYPELLLKNAQRLLEALQ